MSYMALYRKFRPFDFTEVKGQDHIVTTLKHQIEASRIGHAYLFSGTRGTGKTTVAKIFAKAINCENPQDGNPCGTCEMCKGIADGSLMNVIEIDAASNNGVDNIRAIVEEVEYRPTKGQYKVYIIDEAHMLSAGAFNALLKTLEEPPEYVVFILATTEIHKILVTILSRCQRYDFKRINVETIVERLHELIQTEGIEADEKSIQYIAKVADGAMRDAISILDQCVSFYAGQPLTFAQVLELLGAVDAEVFSSLFRKVCSHDVASVLQIIEEQVMEGRDLSLFVADFMWHLRNLLLLKSGANMDGIVDATDETLQVLKKEAELVEAGELVRDIRIFSELSGQLRYATQKRILVEVTFIKMCCPEMEASVDSVLPRIRSLEKKVTSTSGQKIVYVQGDGSLEPKVKEKPKLQNALPEEVERVARDYRQIIKKASSLVRPYLEMANISVGNQNQLLIVLPEDEVAEGVLNSEEHQQDIERLIENKIGKHVSIEVCFLNETQNFEDQYVDLEQFIQMDVIEEE